MHVVMMEVGFITIDMGGNVRKLSIIKIHTNALIQPSSGQILVNPILILTKLIMTFSTI